MAALLIGACVLGGAARPGVLADVVLLVASVVLLAPVLAHTAGTWARGRLALFIAAAAVVWPLLQGLPLGLAAERWSESLRLAGEVMQLIGETRSSSALSALPQSTLASALSALPAFVIFLGVGLSHDVVRRKLSIALVAVGVASVFLGLLQIAQGPDSPLRLHPTADPLDALGIFANRNHTAAFHYMLLLPAAAWTIHCALALGAAPAKKRFSLAALMPLLAAATGMVILLVALMFSRSRAGVALTLIAVGAVVLLAISTPSVASMAATRLSRRVLLGVVLVGLALSAELAIFRVLARLEEDPLASTRTAFASNTFAAALAHQPFGSGLGTFVSVYGLYEKPGDTLLDVYANHAHNDYLELWLETGWLGVALLAAFGMWFISAAVRVWRRPDRHRQRIDLLLSRAASIAVALILLHSLVDYPLRTTALQSLLAFFCALLLPPPDAGAVHATAGRAAPAGETSGSAANIDAAAPQARATGIRAGEDTLSLPDKKSKEPIGSPAKPKRWGEGQPIAWPKAWQGDE